MCEKWVCDRQRWEIICEMEYEKWKEYLKELMGKGWWHGDMGTSFVGLEDADEVMGREKYSKERFEKYCNITG